MSFSDVVAIALVAGVMAVLGYALTRLAHPEPSDPGESRRDSSGSVDTRVLKPVSGGVIANAKNTSDAGTATNTENASDVGTVTATGSDADVENASNSMPEALLIEELNRRLPQTQCAQCGHPGCRPYAEAIIRDHAPINQCPPGGDALIEELAEFLGTEVLPLDSDKGETKPPQVAVIIEPDCIGCALCIAACPVDAIVGAARFMHTVIADQCTGCELCLPPCPVDCIELHPLETPLHRWQWPKPT